MSLEGGLRALEEAARGVEAAVCLVRFGARRLRGDAGERHHVEAGLRHWGRLHYPWRTSTSRRSTPQSIPRLRVEDERERKATPANWRGRRVGVDASGGYSRRKVSTRIRSAGGAWVRPSRARRSNSATRAKAFWHSPARRAARLRKTSARVARTASKCPRGASGLEC